MVPFCRGTGEEGKGKRKNKYHHSQKIKNRPQTLNDEQLASEVPPASRAFWGEEGEAWRAPPAQSRLPSFPSGPRLPGHLDLGPDTEALLSVTSRTPSVTSYPRAAQPPPQPLVPHSHHVRYTSDLQGARHDYHPISQTRKSRVQGLSYLLQCSWWQIQGGILRPSCTWVPRALSAPLR